MANVIKGEQDVRLGDKIVTLRISYETVADMEDALGMGLAQAATKLMDGQLRHSDMAKIIHHAIPGKFLSEAQVGEAIVTAGYGRMQETLLDFLTAVFKREDRPDDEGNAEPASG